MSQPEVQSSPHGAVAQSTDIKINEKWLQSCCQYILQWRGSQGKSVRRRQLRDIGRQICSKDRGKNIIKPKVGKITQILYGMNFLDVGCYQLKVSPSSHRSVHCSCSHNQRKVKGMGLQVPEASVTFAMIMFWKHCFPPPLWQ